MSKALLEMVRQHKAGTPVGIAAVCSAHPLVLRAAIAHAKETGTPVLIEATSNQVDQFGGYTGMKPADFRDLVHEIANEEGLPLSEVILGGDHLGPNRWQKETEAEAMPKALDLVKAYVEAGYEKIHLDCSMPLAGETLPLDDAVVAERAARMMEVAEKAWRDAGLDHGPVYVIGTEVPVPGGAHEELGELQATSPEAARITIAAHRKAFEDHGVLDAWDRIIALVVQPAVEFDHLRVIQYERTKTEQLRHVLDDSKTMLFEAHSTDYQLAERLKELVVDNWLVIKVGPGLTFNLREGLFALAHIEDELIPAGERSNLRDVIENRMVEEPTRWNSYYEGDEDTKRIQRRYSYSDRLRYYLPDEVIHTAQEKLLDNLAAVEIPMPLISQYMPLQYERIMRGELTADPRALAMDRVKDALRPYSYACNPETN